MRYTKKIAIFTLLLTFFVGMYVASAEAQTNTNKRIRRPIIVRNYYYRDPFWSSRYWGYDPFYDPYFYDPYLRAQRDRYYKQKDVKDKAKKLREDREKYARDGVIDAKEQEKLLKRQRDYAKAVNKLNEFNRDN